MDTSCSPPSSDVLPPRRPASGYPLLFLLVMAESGGVPVPGETALITGAVLASQRQAADRARDRARRRRGDHRRQHRLSDRAQGRPLAARASRRASTRQRQQVLAIGEPFFERHGPKAVFFGRFMLGLRVWASWLAGATRMRWRSFVLLERARRHLLGDRRSGCSPTSSATAPAMRSRRSASIGLVAVLIAIVGGLRPAPPSPAAGTSPQRCRSSLRRRG